MNLLIVSGFWPTKKNPISGIFVVQQVLAFARAGISVTVVLPIPFGRPSSTHCTLSELGLDSGAVHLIKVPVLRLPEKLSSLPGALKLNCFLNGFMFERFLRKICKNRTFDNCLIHGERYMGLSFPAWSKWIGGNSVVVIHGVDPYWLHHGNQARSEKLFKRLSEVIASFVLVGSPLRKHACYLGIPLDKINIIPNGTDLPHDSKTTVSCDRNFAPLIIISVSNLVPLKGIDDNIKALAKIYDARPDLIWEYVIIGDGSYRSYLERLVLDLNLTARVKFLGRLPYPETMLEISQADVFSMPSWNEAFGIVYLEAMARSKPVIGCLDNGAADILTDHEDGFLIPPKSVDKLAEALLILLENSTVRKTMGIKARQKAESFSWDANVLNILKLLNHEH